MVFEVYLVVVAVLVAAGAGRGEGDILSFLHGRAEASLQMQWTASAE